MPSYNIKSFNFNNGDEYRFRDERVDTIAMSPVETTGTRIATFTDAEGQDTDIYAPSGGGQQTTWYGTCSTAASTTAKVVTCADYELAKGSIISVFFSTANTAAAPTLNINSTGAKAIRIGGTAPNSTTNVLRWSANTLLTFMYSGSYYYFISAQSAGTLASPDGGGAWYGSSSTAADVSNKTTNTITNFRLTIGTIVSICFAHANTVNDLIQLNVNGTGSAVIMHDGFDTGNNPLLWDAGEVLTFVYDGTCYRYVCRSKPNGGSAATATPSMDGTAAVGSSEKYAREDHVHPTDTSRQEALVSGTNIKTIGGTSVLGSGDIPLPSVPSASSATPAMDGTAAAGSSANYARADHVHPTDTSRQETLVSGTNIKTVGGTSVLGSGDIPLPSGPSAATATPSMDGTAAVGSSAKYAREDHVHPTDTSRQEVLVSGTNIKTVNSNSLLGAGDISVAQQENWDHYHNLTLTHNSTSGNMYLWRWGPLVVCQLTGVWNVKTANASQTMSGTIPDGYRPAGTRQFGVTPVVNNNPLGYVRFQVTNAGVVSFCSSVTGQRELRQMTCWFTSDDEPS